MRVALVATLVTPVRRARVASVERIVWLLARGLSHAGHDVTVFAAPGSDVPGELVAPVPGTHGTDGTPDEWFMCEWMNLGAAIAASGRFDIIHSHAYLWGLPLDALAACPMIHTMHVTPHQGAANLRALYPSAIVTAISNAQWAPFPELPAVPVIPHGLDPDDHPFSETSEEYLCFLGRFIPGKGALEAIRVARALGMPLVLAGPETAYFRDRVAPEVDGDAVRYVGTVGPAERDALLGGSRAMLYPVQEAEPFGLVMVEAMLAGTPVAAYGIGAVPEVVDSGVTGEWVEPGGDLAEVALRCLKLDRAAVRRRAVERFAAERMSRDYLELYERVACARA